MHYCSLRASMLAALATTAVAAPAWAETRYSVVHVENTTKAAVSYQVRWGSGAWGAEVNLAPRQTLESLVRIRSAGHGTGVADAADPLHDGTRRRPAVKEYVPDSFHVDEQGFGRQSVPF